MSLDHFRALRKVKRLLSRRVVKEAVAGTPAGDSIAEALGILGEATKLQELSPIQQEEYDKFSKAPREVVDLIRAGCTITESGVSNRVSNALDASPLIYYCPEDRYYGLREDADIQAAREGKW